MQRKSFVSLFIPALLGAVTFTTTSPSRAHADTPQELLGEPGSSDWQNACEDEIDELYPGTWPIFRPNPALPISKEFAEESGGTDSTPQLESCDSTNPLECLQLVTIDTDTYPNAVCSDGSPGAFYIRPGSGAKANRWLIHLQGGGGCVDYGECVERWCGTQGVYSAAKMSTNWLPEAAGTPIVPEILDKGIAFGARELDGTEPNAFEDWTHVYVYYCSSDGWMGRDSTVAMTNAAGTKTLDVAARGHTILSIVRKMLRRNGPTGTSWHPVGLTKSTCDPVDRGISADQCVPDLDDATHILFSGTSAGALGAIQNADWFLSMFPNARTALALDAAITPTRDALSAHSVHIADPTNPGTYALYADVRDDVFRASWQPGGYFDLVNAFVDETCALTQANTVIDISNLCSHISGLLHGEDTSGAPFIETPTFLRLSLTDSVSWNASRNILVTPDPSGVGFVPIDIDTFAHVMRDSLLDLYDNTTPVTGLFAPRCGKHVGFSIHEPFFLDTTEDVTESAAGVFTAQGVTSTTHDALGEWLLELGVWYDDPANNPAPSTRYADHPLAAGATSNCP